MIDGLSYLSSSYGWAANSIVSAEMVFANGSVGNVTAQSDPELFKAIRGGGNMFGIVTNFELQAYPQEQVRMSRKASRLPTLNPSRFGEAPLW